MAVAAPSFRSLFPNSVVPAGKARVVFPGTGAACRTAGAVNTTVKAAANRYNVNFYKVLSLESEEEASAQDIKKAYRSLARRLHPDVCPPERKEECSRALVEVNRAYEALSDPVLRVHHDAELGLLRRAVVPGRRRGAAQREVWELQLSELARRSTLRMRRKEKAGAAPVAG